MGVLGLGTDDSAAAAADWDTVAPVLASGRGLDCNVRRHEGSLGAPGSVSCRAGILTSAENAGRVDVERCWAGCAVSCEVAVERCSSLVAVAG